MTCIITHKIGHWGK